MKKSAALVGIFVPLYYELVFNFMLYTDIRIKYELIQNIIFYLLQALPGIVMAFALIRNSLKDYFKSLGVCIVLSAIVFSIYESLNINLSILKAITEYDEFNFGEELLFVVTFLCCIVSYFCSAIISGTISLCRQIKKTKNTECIK